MDENIKNSPCKECLDRGVHPPPLAEAEHLRHHLSERDNQIIALEADLIKCNTKIGNLEEQVATWREKYERLYDSHKRVQKLNQNLEDKLLQMVDKMKDEKTQLTKDIATLSIRLAESKNSYGTLQKENERYKNDMNLAIQLLQCKPDNFVSHKLDNLPLDTQNRVSQYIMSKSKPVATPASKNAMENENTETSEYEFNISASLMTKILAESIQDTVTKHCDTCSCSKAQTKPFTYNETHYSVATQTLISGDIKTISLVSKEDIESSYISSPDNAGRNIKIIKDQYNYNLPRPMYIIPQPTLDNKNAPPAGLEKVFRRSDKITNISDVEKRKILYDLEAKVQSQIIDKIGEDLAQLKQNTGVEIEPTVHHKLCDRTKSTIVNKTNINIGEGHNGLYVKELCPISNSVKNNSVDNVSFRKSSQGSMGGVSRTSSLAKSTSSANKSNTHVGPGPRFCSLRMQAGSKNILLDNAQPDVPPVLYKRQTKYAEDVLIKDHNVGFDNLIDVEKNIEIELETTQNQLIVPTSIKKESGVVETTLIDVQVDNNNRDLGAIPKGNSINPVLMNVSSSPLQPLKTHSFTNSNETNNNAETSIKSDLADIDKLLTKSNSDIVISDENLKENSVQLNADSTAPKIFNFDNYEQQSKTSTQFDRPAGVVDINAIENTKISKNSPPRGLAPALIKTESETKAPIPAIVNVYPNLTQTHLKVNASKRKFTEQSSSSLSSDDSAVLLHKQQLLRVAEWVEKNLEQQMNDVSLDEDINFNSKTPKKETSNMDENVKGVALNMPHPVSKYSKPSKVCKENAEGNSSQPLSKARAHYKSKGKESGKPVEYETPNSVVCQNGDDEAAKDPKESLTPEQLARIEYNVRKFLDGPSWDKPDENGENNRRTSSKTETDV